MRYAAIFAEPIFAMAEINLYTRILAICQPKSILQWQLIADYSILASGGIFSNENPLHQTQRFWNLKQIASNPADAAAMPITSDSPGIISDALGDNANRAYSIHLINNSAARTATSQDCHPT